MLLVKIKPLGWTLIALALIIAGIAGFFLSRTPMAGANNYAVDPNATPPPFSNTAKFGHVAATEPNVAKALSAENLDGGEKLVGTKVTFLGHIVNVFIPPSNSVQILNFAQKYKQAMSVAISPPDYPKFPDPKELVGKQVLVEGTVIVFKGHLEVQATSPDQIKIVDGSKENASLKP